jgi:hypothetical protein
MRHGEETRIESHDEVESGGGRALDETKKNNDDGNKWEMSLLLCMLREFNLMSVSELPLYS